jgi:excisionase family DNA binding protein
LPRRQGADSGDAAVDVSALGLWSIPDVASRLRLSPKTIQRLCRSGDIESVKVGRRRLIPPIAVADYLTRVGSKRWVTKGALADILGSGSAPAAVSAPAFRDAVPRAADLGTYVIVAIPLAAPQLPQILSALGVAN